MRATGTLKVLADGPNGALRALGYIEAGYVDKSAEDTAGVKIDALGEVIVQKTTNDLDSAPVLDVRKGKDQKIKLTLGGEGFFSGKITTPSTVDNDIDTTLVTKDYVDVKSSVVSTLQEVTDAGNVTTEDIKIGGTLPSAPNIQLKADGSVVSGPISTQNNTSTVNYLWRKTTTAGDAVLRCKSNVTLTTGSDPFAVKANGDTEISGDVTIGGILSSAPNISLNADGSALYLGHISSGARVGSSTTNDGVTMYPLGYINASRPGSADVWQGRQTGTAGNTSTISADGSAMFAGIVKIGGTSSTDTDGLSVETTEANGGISIISPNDGRGDIFFGDSDNKRIGQIRYSHVDNSLSIRTNSVDRLTIDNSGNVDVIGSGTSAAPNISLNANGSAYFAREVQFDMSKLQSLP